MAAGIANSDNTSGRYYGLFYEPAVRAAKTPYTNICQDDSDQEKRRIMTERVEADKTAWEDRDQQAFDLLRAQVRDFIEWLKGQGAI